jgi:chemotaxis protein methyltransferase CheR
VNAPDLDFLCALVRARSGLMLTGERGFFVETRLAPLARREGLASVSEVIQLVKQQPSGALARAVVEAMTVQETGFFRDRHAFGAISAKILPELAAARPDGLRVWSAGCGQGQEAYSLAMLVDEADHPLPPVKILASDLSTAALEKAQAGVYTHFEVQRGLPIRRLLRHFEELEDAWRISAPLRQQVRWMRLNLIDPFQVDQGYDLIVCRNVVSAFAPDARLETLERLERALAPGGRLMLGSGEPAPAGFEPVPGAPCVFAREGESEAAIIAA